MLDQPIPVKIRIPKQWYGWLNYCAGVNNTSMSYQMEDAIESGLVLLFKELDFEEEKFQMGINLCNYVKHNKVTLEVEENKEAMIGSCQASYTNTSQMINDIKMQICKYNEKNVIDTSYSLSEPMTAYLLNQCKKTGLGKSIIVLMSLQLGVAVSVLLKKNDKLPRQEYELLEKLANSYLITETFDDGTVRFTGVDVKLKKKQIVDNKINLKHSMASSFDDLAIEQRLQGKGGGGSR